jgi:putative transposase
VEEDRQLGEQIETIFIESKRRYGSVRVHQALRKRRRHVSRKRVVRLMQQRQLKASSPRRFVRTTDSRHDSPIAPNVLEQDFRAERVNQKWAGDITYVPTAEGWLYLAVFLDLYSRRVIGWAMSDTLGGELTRRALEMALEDRRPSGRLVVHSDRGVQYAAGAYRQMLADWSITPSMSRRGNCYDNAVSESFFATLKKELVHRERYRTRREAELSIFEYIEVFYNRERLHSTIGYATPVEFEQLSAAEALLSCQ